MRRAPPGDPTSYWGYPAHQEPGVELWFAPIEILATCHDGYLEWFPGWWRPRRHYYIQLRRTYRQQHWFVVGWRPVSAGREPRMIDLGDSSRWRSDLPPALAD